jgi:hypothetical protein
MAVAVDRAEGLPAVRSARKSMEMLRDAHCKDMSGISSQVPAEEDGPNRWEANHGVVFTTSIIPYETEERPSSVTRRVHNQETVQTASQCRPILVV